MTEPDIAADNLSERVFVCTVCGWIHEETRGLPDYDIPPGTRWEELPDEFVCPECGAGKEWFRALET